MILVNDYDSGVLIKTVKFEGLIDAIRYVRAMLPTSIFCEVVMNDKIVFDSNDFDRKAVLNSQNLSDTQKL